MLIGTAIGGGLIIDGKLHRGKDFSAGEFSLVATDAYHPERRESYWSELGWRGLLRRLEETDGRDVSGMSGHAFFELVNQKDSAACAALKQYTDAMAVMLFGLNMLLDLECIAIGGGISRQPALMNCLQESIEQFKEINPDMKAGLKLPLPNVKPCAFFNDANLIGALYHHLYE